MTDEKREEKPEGELEKKAEEQPMGKLERTELAVQNLAKENEKMEANIKRMEDLKADEMLSGTGGAPVKEEKKEMTPEEYTRYIEKYGRAPNAT